MGTIANKLTYTENGVTAAYNAVNSKGGFIADTAPLAELGQAILDIPVDAEAPHQVRFLDYDGTVLGVRNYETGMNATYPAAPTHSFLEFTKWTHILAELSNLDYRESERGLKIPGHVDVGAQYRTSDDKTHIWVSIRPTVGMSLSLQLIRPTGTNLPMNIDWGDGTPVEVFTVNTAALNKTHIFPAAGDYHVQIWTTNNIPYGLGNGTINSQVVTTGNALVTKIYFSDHVLLKPYSCYNFKGLKSVMVPGPDTSQITVTNYMIAGCSNLKHFTIPRGNTILPTNFAANNIILEGFVIPETVTILDTSAFELTPLIKRLVLPRGLNEFSNNLFNAGSALEIICDTISKLGSNAFNSYYLSGAINLASTVTCDGANTFANAYSLALDNLRIILTANPTTFFLNWAHQIKGRVTIGATTSVTLSGISNINSATELLLEPLVVGTTGAITSVGIMKYIIECPAVFSITNVNQINGLNKLAKIYVPDSLVNDYKTATNWSSVADYITPMSEL